jgi:hypothetical protein
VNRWQFPLVLAVDARFLCSKKSTSEFWTTVVLNWATILTQGRLIHSCLACGPHGKLGFGQETVSVNGPVLCEETFATRSPIIVHGVGIDVARQDLCGHLLGYGGKSCRVIVWPRWIPLGLHVGLGAVLGHFVTCNQEFCDFLSLTLSIHLVISCGSFPSVLCDSPVIA